MNEKLRTLFRTLPAAHRAKYHTLYVSIMQAINEGDTEVIPHLLANVPPATDAAAQQEFLAKVNTLLASA